ncbi:hypothetical protein DICVIV_12103 [Dictyocaulus viviparus]|uniref:Uncharacterized protein n=1 Tax=Dictyocaulus viviparus TaxID=29172 RepID=A0A0D8XBD1_DICVI|nr:hypothetical protein DICVIV_12103 [Dictyocaulus viviparus]
MIGIVDVDESKFDRYFKNSCPLSAMFSDINRVIRAFKQAPFPTGWRYCIAHTVFSARVKAYVIITLMIAERRARGEVPPKRVKVIRSIPIEKKASDVPKKENDEVYLSREMYNASNRCACCGDTIKNIGIAWDLYYNSVQNFVNLVKTRTTSKYGYRMSSSCFIRKTRLHAFHEMTP